MALSLQQNLNQSLKLTPEQIQVIKMLEIPTVELRQRIDEELQENPVLEIDDQVNEKDLNSEENDYSTDDDCEDIFGEQTGEDPLHNEDFDYSQYVDDDELPDYRYEANNYSPDDEVADTPIVHMSSFQDYLNEQIGMKTLTELQRSVAEYIVGNIDSRGYLTREPEQMVDDLAFHANVEVSDDEMKSLVELVRSLDPPGVGARDLQDCLLLQLKAKPKSDVVNRAILLTERYFTEVAKHHYERIAKRFNLTTDEVKEAVDLISSLNPTPSSAFSGDLYETQRAHVIPDFRVENIGGNELEVSLIDQDIPSLRISQDYSDMLQTLQTQHTKKTDADREGIRFIKQKMDAANWFINAIRQRNETLLTTMRAIVVLQRDYFLEGDDCFLKPMILEDVARLTGLDPSTISRVSNSKYVLTDFGIQPLKHFFSESLTTDQGDEVSTREVKKIIRELIDQEDKLSPMNDEKLVTILADDGYIVARRTIAKYREQMGIPVARLRRKV